MAHELEGGGDRQRGDGARPRAAASARRSARPVPTAGRRWRGRGARPAASRPTTSTARCASWRAKTIEGVFELDSRLWRTLPDLVLHPARLTRRYLDGHRVAQIPPFRLFLIVVVLVFLAAGLGPPHKPVVDLGGGPKSAGKPALDVRDEAASKDSGLQLNLESSPDPRRPVAGDAPERRREKPRPVRVGVDGVGAAAGGAGLADERRAARADVLLAARRLHVRPPDLQHALAVVPGPAGGDRDGRLAAERLVRLAAARSADPPVRRT